MAEAEDVITDVARHATIFARGLWRRHRMPTASPRPIALDEVAQRINLLLVAVFGQVLPIRIAQSPARATLLQWLQKRHKGPSHAIALPATDGHAIWLPPDLGILEMAPALERYRLLALQQAMRARLGFPQQSDMDAGPLVCELFLLLRSAAADLALVKKLPGLKGSIDAFRRGALKLRPPIDVFPAERRPLESLARSVLQADSSTAPDGIHLAQSAAGLLGEAQRLAIRMSQVPAHLPRGGLLFKDLWTGEFRRPAADRMRAPELDSDMPPDHRDATAQRVARLARKPDVRQSDVEDDQTAGMFMIQPEKPHEHAEDPLGMQRPVDRDAGSAADEMAESLSELPEARLVTTPGRPREVLLSDEAPDTSSTKKVGTTGMGTASVSYPEWDYRIRAYHEPGATVRMIAAGPGPQEWVTATLAKHRAMLNAIKRQFEMLRAHRIRRTRQLDGDEIDLAAYTDGYADFRAGLPLTQALYQSQRTMRRDMAIALLIDNSGSTDGWIAESRRIIDVEREALLLVCLALEGMAEPYTIQAFSGEGPGNVSIRAIKGFDEGYSNDIALRIAALEPEHYTRTGAAMRHATALLIGQPARHRLLLLLSDGKPNDIDDYEGRYGIEDMRQASVEAQLQGISPFCLTIDRYAASYLPAVFGAHGYALLRKPELLPTVLLDFMKQLMVR